MADECDVLDSWEDQEDSGALDKRLNDIQVTPEKCDILFTTQSDLREDSGRTEYTPQVRILKREPVSAKVNHPSHKARTSINSSQSHLHGKSLEQREAEYAEARLRIFGTTADLPEEDAAGDGESTELRPKMLVKKSENNTPLGNEVSRQPRGPDGTTGFSTGR
ncbi:SUZ domain-containing protein 1-like [Gigantopelta aegis]|uniref:SUZ domain-containing protein 1-like n=1 Tax=Gigantopelta aegis TaxID=1735272 RepID=UPI001B88A92C|nr:SUZ domain-containing protein 1-like [Gigantopelta aegis]